MKSVGKNEPVLVIVVRFSACSCESRPLSCKTVEGLQLLFDMCPSVRPVGFKDPSDVEGQFFCTISLSSPLCQ